DQANLVRALDTTSGMETVVAGTGVVGSTGDGGQGTAAKIAKPTGLAVNSSGDLYIATTSFNVGSDNRIRKVTTGGVITTVAGGGYPPGRGGGATHHAPTAPEG